MDTIRVISTVVVIVLIIVVGVSVLWSMARMKKVRATNVEFYALLAPLRLSTAEFQQRPYVFGVYKGYHTAFKWFYPQPRTVPSFQPALFLRVKLPKTAGRQLYVTTGVEGAGSKSVASAVGWEQAEEGFHLAPIRHVSAEEQQKTFALLTNATKKQMQDFTARYGILAVMPEYETTLIGVPNALELVGGNEDVLQQLDLQVRLHMNDTTDTVAITQWTDDALSLAQRIASDLRAQE